MNIEPICFVFMFINVIARKIFARNRLRLLMYYELTRIMYSKVWLDGNSLCAWSFVITSLSYKENFSFLYRMVLFLSSLGLFFSFSLFFFYQGLFSALDFSVSKDFSISKELLRVNFFVGCRDTSSEDSPRSEIMTPSWFLIFHLKIRFSK